MTVQSLIGGATGSKPAAPTWNAVRRERLAGYLFVAPDALGLFIFVAVPMLLALGLGFFEVDGFGGCRFAGLMNYLKMSRDPLFWQSLKVTGVYVALLVPALYATGLGLALLVRRTNRVNGALRAMFFMPQMVSLVVVGLVWQVLAVPAHSAHPIGRNAEMAVSRVKMSIAAAYATPGPTHMAST